MDDIKKREDTESTPLRPDRIHAFLHLFLGVLFFLGALIICSSLSKLVCSSIIYCDFRGLSQAAILVEDLKSHALILNVFVFISSTLPLILAAIITTRFIKARTKDYLLLNKPLDLKWFFYSLVFVFVCIPLMGLMLDINSLIDFNQWPDFHAWLMKKEAESNQIYESLIGNRSLLSFITSIVFMALLPAIAEEIFFRGFLMNIFNGIFNNMHVAILVTAFIFSAMHLQFMKFIPMFFLATVFGYSAYWTGSLFTSILAHFMNNFFAVIQLFYFSDGDYSESLEQSQTLGLPFNIALIFIALLLFIYIQKKSSIKTPCFYV
jgi:membrane protease YdiL (CAAX protease family)